MSMNPEPLTESQLFDCIVIGGGPAGLSASLFLARYHRRVLTLHHNSPRNLYSHGVHGFLGHHGIHPTELLARGRDELTSQGGRLLEACVTRVSRDKDSTFHVTAATNRARDETFFARRVLLATGLRDLMPDCPGFRDFYGSTVHHCPDCDGFESTNKRIAVLGRGKAVVGFALTLLTWTRQLIVVTDGADEVLSEEHQKKLSEFGIPITNQKIAGLEGEIISKQLRRIRFTDNEVLECDAVFFTLGCEPASDLHLQLGCEIDEHTGLVRVDSKQQTSVLHVYAAGDLTPNSQLAVVAAAEGAMAAIHIHKSLIEPGRQLD